jgi:hypothetical protein
MLIGTNGVGALQSEGENRYAEGQRILPRGNIRRRMVRLFGGLSHHSSAEAVG